MKDKIEIGEYVRTKDGIIDKVERFSVGCCVWYCENGMCIDECNCIGTHLEEIVKHSKQLIDLIEVGDYVNGREVKYVAIFEGFPNHPKLIFVDKTHLMPENENIKTILTYEQYNEHCTKVDEQ